MLYLHTPKMKLLHVIDSMDPKVGGPSQGIRNMTENLDLLGIWSEVACLDGPDSKYLENEPMKVHALGPKKGPWGYSKNLIPWLKEHFTLYDIVVVHGLWLYTSYATYKAYKYTKAQHARNIMQSAPSLFLMPHGMLDPYFQSDPARRKKAIRNWFYWKFIESKVINGVDGMFFTCVTELMLARETFTNYYPKSELNIGYGIVDPPVKTEEMMSSLFKKFPEIEKQPYFLFFSRIHEKKGLDLLVDAYQLVLTNPAYRKKVIPKLVIAGPGIDSEFGQKIMRKINSSSHLKASVIFTGMMQGDLKWAVIYGAQAFCLPSHQENFGIAVAEALACGIPVLISNQINIWREIETTGGGIIEDDTLKGTERLFYEWMKLTEADKINMGHMAFLAYENNFNIKPVVEKFVNDLFDHLGLPSPVESN